jgi:hypothetical protein
MRRSPAVMRRNGSRLICEQIAASAIASGS